MPAIKEKKKEKKKLKKKRKQKIQIKREREAFFVLLGSIETQSSLLLQVPTQPVAGAALSLPLRLTHTRREILA